MRRFVLFAVFALVALLVALPGTARAQAGETVKSLDATYDIAEDGTVSVREEITYDFGSADRHGIFRYTPVRYEYDDDRDRFINVDDVEVTQDGDAAQYEITSRDPNLTLKIGDPDVTITGEHEYVISYTLDRALNPFDDHDEFYWNVTGNDWDVPVLAASGVVTVPADTSDPIQQIACYQGELNATDLCETAEFEDNVATFESRGILFQGEGLTLVVGLKKGVVDVAAPNLEDKPVSPWVKAFELNPVTLGIAGVGAVLAVLAVLRLWWVQGRDRWAKDMFYINGPPLTTEGEAIKPLFAHETIVVEFEPPPVDEETKRSLRPAEIGVLLDEKADTLDVSATIVDLAVRKHLLIREESSGGVFGLFKSKDYELERLEPEKSDLLDYEAELKDALFEDGPTVKLSDLKNKFHSDLAKVKSTLYKQALADKFFRFHPETVRTVVRVVGIVLSVGGGLSMWGFGVIIDGGAYLAIPLVVAGVLLLLFAGAFPSRTANGRILYRRSLGFRRFMVESDKERQKFAERANIFHEYLPYAIVYGCVEKWANVFKQLGIDVGQPGYYVGVGPFIAADFASNMSSFSSSIGSTMASTPGGSGGSGFGGGGGSGGGGGGGGGGSW